jgi:hypothetical protein
LGREVKRLGVRDWLMAIAIKITANRNTMFFGAKSSFYN